MINAALGDEGIGQASLPAPSDNLRPKVAHPLPITVKERKQGQASEGFGDRRSESGLTEKLR